MMSLGLFDEQIFQEETNIEHKSVMFLIIWFCIESRKSVLEVEVRPSALFPE